MEKALKLCKKCGLVKEFNNFGTDKRAQDGKKRFCKECISQLNRDNFQANRDKKVAQILEWQQNNKEKVKEFKRAYAKRKRKQG